VGVKVGTGNDQISTKQKRHKECKWRIQNLCTSLVDIIYMYVVYYLISINTSYKKNKMNK